MMLTGPDRNQYRSITGMVNYSSRPLLGQVLVGPFQSVSVLCQSKVSQIEYLTKASKKRDFTTIRILKFYSGALMLMPVIAPSHNLVEDSQ